MNAYEKAAAFIGRDGRCLVRVKHPDRSDVCGWTIAVEVDAGYIHVESHRNLHYVVIDGRYVVDAKSAPRHWARDPRYRGTSSGARVPGPITANHDEVCRGVQALIRETERPPC